MDLSIMIKIDEAIKTTWLEDIYQDYHNDHILREDALKNSFYYHLRSRLGDGFLKRHMIRIYPEYNTGNYRADIVIAKLHPKKDFCNDYYLVNRVAQVLAIIEFKYKSGTSHDPFISDIKKARKYIKSKTDELKESQLYLGFIHEALYQEKDCFWLTKRQRETWALNYLTEMVGYYNAKNEGYFETKIASYNGLNNELNSVKL